MISRVLTIDQHHQDGGGTERYLRFLHEGLARRGVEVTHVYARRTPATRDLRGVRAVHLPWLDDHHPGRRWATRRSLVRLERLIGDLGPDVVHVHNLRHARVVGRVARAAPALRTVHDPSLGCFRDWRLRPDGETICHDAVGTGCEARGCLRGYPVRATVAIRRKRVELHGHASLRRIVVGAPSTREDLVRCGLDPARIDVIPLPVAAGLPPAADPPDPEGDLLFVGLVHRIKGVDLALEALARTRPSRRLRVVGRGDPAPFRELADRLGVADRVRWVGPVPADEVAEHYRACSLLVVPSRWPEPFGLVGPEALSHGRPVVAFDVGGISAWLDDGRTGRLVPAGDVEGLAGAIESLLSEPALLRELGRGGRDRCRGPLDPERHLDRLLDL